MQRLRRDYFFTVEPVQKKDHYWLAEISIGKTILLWRSPNDYITASEALDAGETHLQKCLVDLFEGGFSRNKKIC